MTRAEFTAWLKKLNLDKKGLSAMTGLNYNSINNWNGENKPFPSWIRSWFENYEMAQKYKALKEALGD